MSSDYILILHYYFTGNNLEVIDNYWLIKCIKIIFYWKIVLLEHKQS